MQIEPSAAAFAARYAAGEAQVVWTTLVADLETPVSAFLKIADGRPMSFLLESVEGGEVRGRYSIIGLEPDVIFRSNGGDGGDQSNAAQQSGSVRAGRSGAAASAARADRRKPHRAAGHAAADGGRRVRLSRLRHGASDGGYVGRASARSDRDSGSDPAAADFGGRLRCREGHHHRRHAGAAACRRQRRGRACARRRALVGDRRCARPAARQICQGRSTPGRSTSCRARTPRRKTSSAWCCAPRNTSPPATFFRWCCRSASRRRSRLRRSRSIARCGA